MNNIELQDLLNKLKEYDFSEIAIVKKRMSMRQNYILIKQGKVENHI